MQPSMTIDDKIKIVADFVGWIHHENPEYDKYEMENKTTFHTSWDSLHKVWAKLNGELLKIIKDPDGDGSKTAEARAIRAGFGEESKNSNLPAAFEAVVSGIELLNNKK